MGSFTIYPAVDIKGGRAVRLLRGELSAETVYGDPVEMAVRWREEGAEWLHIVDLDGAASGVPKNLAAIAAILGVVDIPVQLGGGLRNIDAIGAALDAGCARVVIGSIAAEDPTTAREAADRWPRRLALGLDLRAGQVATHGWTEAGGQAAADVIDSLSGVEFGCVITTDIARDGTMTGPGLDSLAAVLACSPWPVVASGGITSSEDIRAVREVERNGNRAAGAIVGRALYEDRVSLKDLIEAGC